MKYSVSLSVGFSVLPVSAISPLALCMFAGTIGRYCLPACWHQLPSRRLGVNAYMREHIFGCMSVFKCVSSTLPFLPSRLCIIGLKPAKPFVCVLPCAYINSAVLLNNFAKWTNSATDFLPLFLAPVFFLR